MLRLNFNHARTNSAMTHVMVLGAKARRKELLKMSDCCKFNRHW